MEALCDENEGNRRSLRIKTSSLNASKSALPSLSADGGHPDIPIGTPEHQLPESITVCKVKKYNLNPEKALNRKLAASTRDEMYEVEKVGDGTNINCQAGLFEYIRRAACMYYANFRVAGSCVEILVQIDKGAAVVQCTFRVRKYGGQTSYLLDLYHTTSTVRVSGKGQAKFFDVDWHNLCDIIEHIEGNGTNIPSLNATMKKCLEEALQTSRMPKSNNKGGSQRASRRGLVMNANLPAATCAVSNSTTAVIANSEIALPVSAEHDGMSQILAPNNTAGETNSTTAVIPNSEIALTVSAEHDGMSQILTPNNTAGETNNTATDSSRNALDRRTPHTGPLRVNATNSSSAKGRSSNATGCIQPQILASAENLSSFEPEDNQVRNPRSNVQKEYESLSAILDARQREIISKEADLALKEKRLNTQRKELDKRSKEVSSKEIQNEALRSTLAHLERKVQEMKEENSLLNARILSLENDTHSQTQRHNEPRNCQSQMHRPEMPSDCQNRPTCSSLPDNPTCCDSGRRCASQPQIIIAPNFSGMYQPCQAFPSYQPPRHPVNFNFPMQPAFHHGLWTTPTPQWTTAGPAPGMFAPESRTCHQTGDPRRTAHHYRTDPSYFTGTPIHTRAYPQQTSGRHHTHTRDIRPQETPSGRNNTPTPNRTDGHPSLHGSPTGGRSRNPYTHPPEVEIPKASPHTDVDTSETADHPPSR